MTSISIKCYRRYRTNDSGEYGALHESESEKERDIITYWSPITAGEVTWLEEKNIFILMFLNLKSRLKEGNLYWAAVNFVVWGISTWNVIKGFLIYYLFGPLRNIFCGLWRDKTPKRRYKSLCSPKHFGFSNNFG